MNPFLHRLREGRTKPALGTFVMSGSPLVAEALGCQGFEWCVLDMEHGTLDLGGVLAMLQALSSTPMLPMVRIPALDAVTVKRVLDVGATTLLVPYVEDAKQAREVVAALRYPPHGIRGVAGNTRATRFGALPDALRTADSRCAAFVQIESLRGVDNLDEILAVEGIAGVFVGPADLSASMGLLGQLQHPQVLALVASIAQRSRAAGRMVGTLVGSHADLARYPAASFDFVAIGSDLGLLQRAARAELQQAGAAPAASGGGY